MGRPKKVQQPVVYRNFEECYTEICKLIEMRKFRWQLTALNWMDWSDVRQQLLKHIWVKWHLYKQEMTLASWINKVINNQMINMIRNHYGNFKKPCIGCEFYEEDNRCAKFGEVSTKCELFRTWVHGKKTKHDIQLPVSMENYTNEVHEIKSEEIDIEKTAEHLHKKMKEVLKPLEWTVYNMLYVKKMDEIDVAKALKLKSREKNRNPGYSRVNQLRKIILVKVKQVLRDGDVEIVGDNNS